MSDILTGGPIDYNDSAIHYANMPTAKHSR